MQNLIKMAIGQWPLEFPFSDSPHHPFTTNHIFPPPPSYTIPTLLRSIPINSKFNFAMGYLSCKTDSSLLTFDSSRKILHHKPIEIQEFNYQDLQLATNNFSDSKLLGRGSHGVVYKGVLSSGRRVAVKKPSGPSSFSENNEVENEIDILSSLRSPGVVNLVGFTNTDSHNRLLVVEFMSNGTLYDVLHSNSRPPNWGRRIRLALQTAKAIDTLHSLTPPVIHRDVKSANILIDRNFNARLGDFGLALRCVDDCRLKATPPAGTMGYLDPGYVTPDGLSTKTDVFSFGILLLEIISGRKAIDLRYSPASVVDWAIPLIRRRKLSMVFDPRIVLPKDGLVRKMLAVLAAKCVRSSRERRPSMKEVVVCLSELSKLVPIHSWNGLGMNPCLTVGTVVRPVGLKNEDRGAPQKNDQVVAGKDRRAIMDSQRVYSDLGFRSNLMELMTGPNGESSFRIDGEGEDVNLGSIKRVPSLRFESCRLVDTAKIQSTIDRIGKSRVSSSKRNQA